MKLGLGSKNDDKDSSISLDVLNESIQNLSEKIDKITDKFDEDFTINEKLDSIYEGLKIVNDKINYMGNLMNFQHKQSLGTFATFEKRYGIGLKRNHGEVGDLRMYFKKNDEILDLLRSSLAVMSDVLDSVKGFEKKGIMDRLDEEKSLNEKKLKLKASPINLNKNLNKNGDDFEKNMAENKKFGDDEDENDDDENNIGDKSGRNQMINNGNGNEFQNKKRFHIKENIPSVERPN
ncbi:MAG: hypothetical protein KC589_07945 [Nanoarchaeota archaeon]|nr:hypothetical protein [Nanoarchaeota archaeon]